MKVLRFFLLLSSLPSNRLFLLAPSNGLFAVVTRATESNMEPHWNFEKYDELQGWETDALLAVIFGIIAAFAAIGVTLVIEKCGGIVGGVIGTLPTTIVPASLGVAIFATHVGERALQSSDYWGNQGAEDGYWTRTSQAANVITTMYAVPAGLLLDVVFLLLWRELPRFLTRLPGIAALCFIAIVSLTFWAVSALSLVYVLRYLLSLHVSIRVIGIACLILHGSHSSLSFCAPRRSLDPPQTPTHLPLQVDKLSIFAVFSSLPSSSWAFTLTQRRLQGSSVSQR